MRKIVVIFAIVFLVAVTGCAKKQKTWSFQPAPLAQADFNEKITAAQASMLGSSLVSWAHDSRPDGRVSFKGSVNETATDLNIVFDPPLSTAHNQAEAIKLIPTYTDQCLEQMANRSDFVKASFYLSLNAGLLVADAFMATTKNDKIQISAKDRQSINARLSICKQIITDMQMPQSLIDQFGAIESKLAQAQTNRDWVLATFDLTIWQANFSVDLLGMPDELRPGGRAFDTETNSRLETKSGGLDAANAGLTMSHWLLALAGKNEADRVENAEVILQSASALDIVLDPDPASIKDAQSGKKAIDKWVGTFTANLVGSRFLLSSFLTGYAIGSFTINNYLLANTKPDGPYSVKELDSMIKASAMIDVASKDMGLPHTTLDELELISDDFVRASNGKELKSVNKKMEDWFIKSLEQMTPPNK